MTRSIWGAMLRGPTPLGWIVVALGGMAIAGLLLSGLGWRWDPLDLSRRRADRALASAAAAQAEAAARTAEAHGQASQVARLDAAVNTLRSLDRATQSLMQEARTADDANESLSPDRVDRLRDHDRELCRIAPDLVGCAAASDPAIEGEPAV